MKPKPLEELYAQLAPVSSAPSRQGMEREVGHFNVFNVADLMRGRPNKPPMAFDRRAFYKICLIRGCSLVEYADQTVPIAGAALWVATSKAPYRWLPQDAAQTGYFCVFTDEFLLPTKGQTTWAELPLFQSGAPPVVPVTDAEYAAVEAVFEKMAREITSAYAYKYDLLRAYLLELIHLVQRLWPAPAPMPARSAAARLAAQFADLLERQFPLQSSRQQLRLRTAADYAGSLAVHVNHLNRVLKETTGQTTTALLAGRVAQEARMLLKQTDWNVSEIADCLGFADVAHFCNFFKRQTGLVPGAFRVPG